MTTSKRCVKFLSLIFILKCLHKLLEDSGINIFSGSKEYRISQEVTSGFRDDHHVTRDVSAQTAFIEVVIHLSTPPVTLTRFTRPLIKQEGQHSMNNLLNHCCFLCSLLT